MYPDDGENSSDSDNIVVSSVHNAAGPLSEPEQPPAKPALTSTSTSHALPPPIASLVEEEDITPASTNVADPFDSSASDSSRRNLDENGQWRRFGSSESATSISISSNNSSVIVDPKPSLKLVPSSPALKRMLDGSFKKPEIPIDASPAVPSLTLLSGNVSSQSPAQATQPPDLPTPKRRGRPPKDKSSITGFGPRVRRASFISQLQPTDVRPRSSIPNRLPVNVFASQCIEAARSSRLNPYALHQGEHDLLADLILDKEVTVYLNIRNAILRIWRQNSLCSVTPEEAAGCAKEARFFGLAEVAYKWLVRNGYINFGCVEPLRDVQAIKKLPKASPQKTVVVIGAGVSGLTTARQLEGLFAQSSEKWTEKGERPPRVIVLEGRTRIGGRVYSKPLRGQDNTLPDGLRSTAEMGAMIVTGFEHGNPLDTVIRGQLGLRYHLMTDELTIYDTNGRPIDEQRDMLNTELYTDISDRTGHYRALPQQVSTLQGDEDLIKRCRDPAPNGLENYMLEPLFDPLDPAKKPTYRRGRRRNAPPGTEKLTGRSRVIEESGATQSAARAAKEMGWHLRDGVSRSQSVSLHRIASASTYPSLGAVMDGAIEQYKNLVHMKPKDMRLLNWHHANLEYANAAPVSSLSLSGHDQDTGNEFEGAHSEIIGGYTQLPRGLMNLPTRLDVKFERFVDSIHYRENDDSGEDVKTKVVCSDGEVIEADRVVLTTPLGVLKSDAVDFDPPLPSWKRGAINRMGFGLLNKVILLYDKPFWDDSRDMFGLLNEPDKQDSLDTADYAKKRGRFYLIWNASKTSGRPMLVALMAGNAAHEVEKTDTSALLAEITTRLRKVFVHTEVPAPLEVIVTRWRRDPFTRGTYSFVAPETRPGDYDLMAKRVGNLHFAGEATCGTHPATVHGAFLSGLRVAGEVMESLVGPVRVPDPLVKPMQLIQPTSYYGQTGAGQAAPPLHRSLSTPLLGQASSDGDVVMIKQEGQGDGMLAMPSVPTVSGAPRHSVCAGDSSFWVQSTALDSSSLNYEAGIIGALLAEIGERPLKPSRPGVNPFLLFTKAKWDECKEHCSSKTGAAGRDLIRQTLGKWWRAASQEDKQPYVDRSQAAQEQADAARKEWEVNVVTWDKEAARIRSEYVREHPVAHGPAASASAKAAMEGIGVSRRKTNVSNNVVLDHV